MKQEIKVTNIDATQPLKVANTYTFMTEGAADYAQLINKPSINNVPLIGNKTSAELGIKQSYTADEITSVGTTNQFVTSAEKSAWNAKSDFSGSYTDLSNKPTIPSDVADLTDTGDLLFSGDYADLDNKPFIPATLADLSDDATHRVVTDTEKSTWNNKSDFSGSYDDLSNKPSIPAALSQLTDDATHRTVTDTEKLTWNTKQDALGFVPENTANKGIANGYAPLDGGGKIPMSNLPSTILHYIGTWDASTNTPELISPDVSKVGNVYTVSGEGIQFGISWKLGDWLIYNASGVPEKSDNSDDVVSVNTKTGAVVLNSDDISDADRTNKFVTTTEKNIWNAKATEEYVLDAIDAAYGTVMGGSY